MAKDKMDEAAELKPMAEKQTDGLLYVVKDGKVTDELLPAGATTPGRYYNKSRDLYVDLR